METNQRYFPDRGFNRPKLTRKECPNPAFADHRLHRIGLFAQGELTLKKCVNCGKEFGTIYLARFSAEKAKEYYDKACAKKLGLTVEQLEAKRKAALESQARNRELRERNEALLKERKKSSKKAKPAQKQSRRINRDAWWAALKKKHAGKPRLTESIKPPILLNLQDDEE